MFHSTTDIDLIFLINYLHLKLIRGFTDSKINVTSYIKTSPDTLYRYYTLLIMGKRRPDAPGE
ncbi:MAG: hypothetical protein L6R37_008427, partial [Teloschistes peruensis]